MLQEVVKATFSFPLKSLGVFHILPSGPRLLCRETQCSGCPTLLCLCGLCGRIVYMLMQQVAANNMAACQHYQHHILTPCWVRWLREELMFCYNEMVLTAHLESHLTDLWVTILHLSWLFSYFWSTARKGPDTMVLHLNNKINIIRYVLVITACWFQRAPQFHLLLCDWVVNKLITQLITVARHVPKPSTRSRRDLVCDFKTWVT